MSNTTLIEETNFHRAWSRAIHFVLNNGKDRILGGVNKRAPIKDATVLISLRDKAIDQILNREIHPKYPFKSIDEYCKTFTYEYLDEYNNKKKKEKFAYLYFDRLCNYSLEGITINQIDKLKKGLKIQIENNYTSNTNQGITWYPLIDFDAEATPCLQRIQTRYVGNDEIVVYLDWRSRDAYNAFQANIIAIISMIQKEIANANGCRIVEINDYSSSLHLYNSDIQQAERVVEIPKFI